MKKTLQYTFIFLILNWGFSISTNAQSINDLLVSLENTNKSEEKLSLYKQLAYTYQKEQAYVKSSEYLQKAYQLEKNVSEKIALQEKIGSNNLALKKYPASLKAFEQAYQLSEKQGKSQRNILATMVSIANKQENYTQAINYNEKLLALDRKSGNDLQTAQTLNNMGVLYQANKQNDKATQAFQEALTINEKLYRQNKKLPTAQQNSQILNNMATLHNYMGNYDKAMIFLKKAESLEKQQLKPKEVGKTKNLKAITYYLQGNNTKAREELEKALKIGESINDKSLLAESYQILAEIQTSEGNSQEAQENFKKYLKLKDEIQAEESQKQKALLDKQIETEKRESQMLQLISENQRKALELEQAKLESEKKQQALELQKQQLLTLERDKQLQATQFKNQALEKQRVKQALALAEAKLAEEKRQKEIDDLEKQKELQALALEKQKLKEAESKKEKELLKQKQKLQDKELEKQKANQFFMNLLLWIGAGVLLIILIFFYISFRSSRKLAKQNKEIKEQNEKIEKQSQEVLKSKQQLQEAYEETQVMNEELRQTQEELQTQRDYVEEKNESLEKTNQKLASSELILRKMNDNIKNKNKELEFFNQKINNSIKSAKTIQEALLPTQEKLHRTLEEYFLIYRPKDVVSGDFYWLTLEGNKTYLAVADCTGHGVPGAFMANMGITFLYSLIRQKKLEDPAEILKLLHREVSVSLKQAKTGNNNGMDIALISMEKLENEHTKIAFCGAKRPLYYISSDDNILQEIKGTRKAIGGIQNKEIKFVTHEVVLPKNSLLYLGSDGFADQNNKSRKKFGGKKMKSLIQEIHQSSFSEQKNRLEVALDTHMEDTLQRDDILWLGIKI